MFLVNFLGNFDAMPAVLKHHNTYCSYADTIMPQFFFAVGFAMRLVMLRRVEKDGPARAYRRAIWRILALVVVALIVHAAPSIAKSWNELTTMSADDASRALRASVREWFQTLMHIAVTSLWVLPVIRASAAIRVGYAILSAALFFAASYAFYFDWVQTGGIDGGVLGFFAWTIPVLTGTLAYDAVAGSASRPSEPSRDVPRMAGIAVLMMLLGWLLSAGTTLYDIPPGATDSAPVQLFAVDPVIPDAERWSSHSLRFAEPPLVAPPDADRRELNFWMMSQRAATLSYHVFAAGLSLAVYAFARFACDGRGMQLGLFRTLGTNALAAYILHGLVGAAAEAFVPSDAPAWYVLATFLVYFVITYAMLRSLEKQGAYVSL
jgi:hypothetical protein